jgi:hypothetical protein
MVQPVRSSGGGGNEDVAPSLAKIFRGEADTLRPPVMTTFLAIYPFHSLSRASMPVQFFCKPRIFARQPSADCRAFDQLGVDDP